MKATTKIFRFLMVDPPLVLLLFLASSPPSPGPFPKTMGSAQAQSAASRFNEAKFSETVAKVEADVLEQARKVAELYQNRCEVTLLSDCYQGNYEHCLSSYPEETCPGGPDFDTPECGKDQTCSALYSFSVTSVSLPWHSVDPVTQNPTDPQVIETICFTKGLDEYFVQKRARDEAFWAEIGFQPNFKYFGSHNGGVFRLSPATHYSSCNTFDPRIRPWYVAASSGPKNIIMVVDRSGSMSFGGKMDALKEAAKRVIETASVSDRIAIIPFNENATEISDKGYMYVATNESKSILKGLVDELVPRGGTNFYDAFVAAFDVLDRSIEEEIIVPCNTAILFFTDGIMDSDSASARDDVIDLVIERLNTTSAKLSEPIQLFTYSLSGGDPAIDEFPKQLACATGTGVFSKIDYEENIVDSLASYYRLFALGLGSGPNEDFTAWVEPYIFFTRGALGTTVSAPVYDNSKSPPLFLGVVGIDFTLKALDAALGVTDATSAESFRRVVKRSTARCPRLELTACELESYRRQSNTAGDDALCNVECSEEELVQVQEKKCPFVSDYPGDVWINRDNENIVFTDKGCCRLSDSFAEPDPTCSSSDGNDPPIALIVSVTIGGIVVLIVAVVLYRRRRRPKPEMPTIVDQSGGEREQAANQDSVNSRRVLARLESDRSEPAQSSDPPQPGHIRTESGPPAVTEEPVCVANPVGDVPIAQEVSKEGDLQSKNAAASDESGSLFQTATGAHSNDGTSTVVAVEASPMIGPDSHIRAAGVDGSDPGDNLPEIKIEY